MKKMNIKHVLVFKCKNYPLELAQDFAKAVEARFEVRAFAEHLSGSQNSPFITVIGKRRKEAKEFLLWNMTSCKQMHPAQ